ncbi:SDR family NAD(P)-dependent oxidoreductase [uncultured Tateyamaria sp.]|uniref:SDR family NAD(P)-dependent oxidoreductase n=1 Tax=uncultured Tateyamaria sp. TaxID=455651 RepID=UPI00262BFB5F|nr:SDR family oxidoreductase [uncultured Tateyamaria sp.]
MARKAVLVTGGARGIGAGIVAELARDHDVMVHYNTTAPDADVASVQGNLTDADVPAHLVATTLDRFGRLDAVVHNAGDISVSPLDQFTPDDYRRMFDVNLFAAQGLLAAAAPHFGAWSCMVNISSVNAVLPPMGAAMYGASKAALDLWTRGAAKEMGPRGIRINGVAPGAIDVPDAGRDDDLKQAFIGMTALGRMGLPADIAGVVRFLLSDAASFITGEVLTVSGGYRL